MCVFPHTFTGYCVFVVSWCTRCPYCTEPAGRENISILGKDLTPLYGEASSRVTAPSAGISLAFLQLQVSLGVFHFRFAGWRRSRAAFHKSLAWCVIPFSKKIHKPLSRLFPAILHFGVWCSKISLARDRAHLAFQVSHRLNLIRQVSSQRTWSRHSRNISSVCLHGPGYTFTRNMNLLHLFRLIRAEYLLWLRPPRPVWHTTVFTHYKTGLCFDILKG